MANSIYSTTMISNGGRDGRVFSPDNTFVQNLATPKEMGGQGGNDTNPEQLFAAGYSACFNSALSLILSQNKISDANPEVEITIELLKDDTDNGFKLGADIKVTLENMSQQVRCYSAIKLVIVQLILSKCFYTRLKSRIMNSN